MRRYSDAHYGELNAILTDDDPVGKLCLVRGADRQFVTKVVAHTAQGFFQIHDGRLFPKGRVLGVLFAAIREEGVKV